VGCIGGVSGRQCWIALRPRRRGFIGWVNGEEVGSCGIAGCIGRINAE
jgi:hypothetical protein